MLNRSASLAMSTSVFKVLPGKLDIKRHEPGNLFISLPICSFFKLAIIDFHVDSTSLMSFIRCNVMLIIYR